MIELNLTYEESKKILELGYDFSKVCTVFTYAAKVSFFKIPMTNNVYTDGIKFYEEGSQEGFIPIIPKDALEACLPDINPSNDERLPDLDTSRLRVSKYHTDMCDREHEEIIREFNSVFEAFTWCHENYPKELKKKFEEVMK